METSLLLGLDRSLSGRAMESIAEWRRDYAEAYQALMAIERKNSTTRGKGFTLTRLPSKKLGYVFYIRYKVDGADVSTKFTTHTSDRETAEVYARANRERLLAEYHARKEKKQDALEFFLSYYKKDSEFLAIAKSRGRRLCEESRRKYYNFIKKVFVPFLREYKHYTFSAITPPVLSKFQDELLKKGNKPQTINGYFTGLRAVFKHLIRNGTIKENPVLNVESLETGGKAVPRGCHELEKLRGVFDKEWDGRFLIYCAL
jgi:hypothetical protein